MVPDGSGRAGARRGGLARSVTGVVALVLAPLLAGCVTEAGQHTRGATIAFESIDGLPRPVFDRLVARLDAEATTRQVAVVSRAAAARYRVRAYLAATVEPRRTTIHWVWDVYDSDLRRAIRLAGEEPASRSRQDAWAAADDRVLGRIAAAGMTQLAAFAAGPGVATPDAVPTAPQTAPPEPSDPPVPPDRDIRVAAATPSTAAFVGGLR